MFFPATRWCSSLTSIGFLSFAAYENFVLIKSFYDFLFFFKDNNLKPFDSPG